MCHGHFTVKKTFIEFLTDDSEELLGCKNTKGIFWDLFFVFVFFGGGLGFPRFLCFSDDFLRFLCFFLVFPGFFQGFLGFPIGFSYFLIG